MHEPCLELPTNHSKMLADYYCKTLYKKFDYFSTWHPTKQIRLGDIGVLDGFQFKRKANLADLGIPFEVLFGENAGKLDFYSDKEHTLKTVVGGSADEVTNGIGEGEVGLELTFSADKAIALQVDGTRTLSIRNQLSLAKEIEKRFSEPQQEDPWEKNWVVVTELIEGEQGTVIVTEDRGAQITLKAKAKVNPTNLNLASASAKFDTVFERSIGTKAIGESGITPLFKLSGIHKTWWSNKVEFKDKGLRGVAEAPTVLPLGFMPEVESQSLAMPIPQADLSGANIHVLSIGINEYACSKIPNLSECVNDTKRLKEVLQKTLNIPEEQYRLLHNKEATREGVINAFRSHFSNLKDGDTAVLHFSGHGSQEPASKAFVDAGLEAPDGTIEVLVCQDSRQGNTYNLADKELRWLIHELQYPQDGPPRRIHFVALLDCCHSGSMFRQEGDQMKARLDKFAYSPRPIEAFLDQKYKKQLEEEGQLFLPKVDYVSLSACSPDQLAVEVSNQGGLFTTALCQVLGTDRWGGRLPTYPEMHGLIRDRVANYTGNRQLPLLEYNGRVDPNTCFLQMGTATSPTYPRLRRRQRDWAASIGAIHGLDNNAAKHQVIPIYSSFNTASPCAWAEVVAIEVEFTRLKITSGASRLDENKDYLVGLFAPPIPVVVDSSSKDALNALQKIWQTRRFAHQFLEVAKANYRLVVKDEYFAIYKNTDKGQRLIVGIRETGEETAQIILQKFEWITRWEQLNALTNPRNSTLKASDVVIEFKYPNPKLSVIDFADTDSWLTKRWDEEDQAALKVEQVVLPFDPENGGIPYQITLKLKKSSKFKTYFYLVYLGWKYKVEQKFESYSKPVYGGESIKLYDSFRKGTGLGFLEQDLDEILETFLLIGSHEPLSMPNLFEQDGFDEEYGTFSINKIGMGSTLRKEIGLKQDKAKWMVKRFEILIKKT